MFKWIRLPFGGHKYCYKSRQEFQKCERTKPRWREWGNLFRGLCKVWLGFHVYQLFSVCSLLLYRKAGTIQPRHFALSSSCLKCLSAYWNTIWNECYLMLTHSFSQSSWSLCIMCFYLLCSASCLRLLIRICTDLKLLTPWHTHILYIRWTFILYPEFFLKSCQ